MQRFFNVPSTSPFNSERAGLFFTIAFALLLIVSKGTGDNQPGVLGTLVRQYVEETSASVVPAENVTQASDVNTLMGLHSENISPNAKKSETTSTPYLITDNSVQAVAAISKDYLDDYKPHNVADYIVQPGDALSFIASDYGVSAESILWSNDLPGPDNIKPGQVLKIPPVSGVIHKIKDGDTVASIAKKYSADEKRIMAFNELSADASVLPGQDIIVPDGTAPMKKVEEKALKKAKPSVNSKRFSYLPDFGGYFQVPTTGFNWGVIHGRNGIDIANSCGTPVYATAGGKIVINDISGWNGGFGKFIKIAHDNGAESIYAHLSKSLVTDGEEVEKGQQIGVMGTTGRSTGCHLHFEVHGARNPLANY